MSRLDKPHKILPILRIGCSPAGRQVGSKIESIMSDVELDPKVKESINAALASNWERALELNLALAKEYPDDPETFNRLARAYLELGQVSKAREHYNKVLKIDPYNSIATKNLKRLGSLRKKDIQEGVAKNGNVDPDIFLEEPGKTKVINIVDLAMPKVLASLRIGEPVQLVPQKNFVIVLSSEGKRVGKVAAEWSKRLAKALRAGSKFTALVKSAQIKSSSEPSLSIFVKETKRSSKLSESIFPTTSDRFTPYIREESMDLLSEKNKSDSTIEIEAGGEVEDLPKEELPPEEKETSSLETLAEQESQEDQPLEDE